MIFYCMIVKGGCEALMSTNEEFKLKTSLQRACLDSGFWTRVG